MAVLSETVCWKWHRVSNYCEKCRGGWDLGSHLVWPPAKCRIHHGGGNCSGLYWSKTTAEVDRLIMDNQLLAMIIIGLPWTEAVSLQTLEARRNNREIPSSSMAACETFPAHPLLETTLDLIALQAQQIKSSIPELLKSHLSTLQISSQEWLGGVSHWET